ncbi:MAG: hypothetical protein Kow0081_0440 [Candidatus Dojkabacteria bacterium]
MDFGPDTLREQLRLLDEVGIITVGAGENIEAAFTPNYKAVNGITLGFIALNEIETFFQNAGIISPGSAFFDATRIEKAIKTAKANSDFVIILPHWGNEHSKTSNISQRKWAKNFIDWGADFVVGAHPHVTQETEYYNNCFIHYSLGNFIFSSIGWNPEAVKGAVLEIVFSEKQIKSIKTLPIEINYHGFPSFVSDGQTI